MKRRKRACGDCAACCMALSIEELKKPERSPCQHEQARVGSPKLKVLGSRCAIYAQRPKACRAFECAWLQGWGRGEDRPDRLGAVLYEQMSMMLGPVPTIVEVVPGALETFEVRAVVRALERLGTMVLLVAHDGMRTLKGHGAKGSQEARAIAAELGAVVRLPG